MSIKPVSTPENPINVKILKELQKIKEAIQEGRDVTTGPAGDIPNTSPYAPDRTTAKNYQIQNSEEETKWKEVLTFDQLGYQRLIKLSSDEEQRKLIHDTIKKLNII